MTDIQTERAFQKQKGVFMNAKKTSKKDRTPRFFKKIGLGFKRESQKSEKSNTSAGSGKVAELSVGLSPTNAIKPRQ